MNASTKSLTKGVQNIAKGAGCSEPAALKMFVQCSLMALVGAQNAESRALALRSLSMWPGSKDVSRPSRLSFTAEAIPTVFGFETNAHCPMDRVVDELSESMETYLGSVKCNEPFSDLLSDVVPYFVTRSERKRRGQAFTNSALASALTKFANLEGAPEGGATIGDPTCGAGALVLAPLRHLHSLGGLASAEIWANDIDPLCSAVTALQVHANQVIHRLPVGRVLVTVGDCIRQDYRRAYESRVWIRQQEDAA